MVNTATCVRIALVTAAMTLGVDVTRTWAAPIFGAQVVTGVGGLFIGSDNDSIVMTYGVDTLAPISSAVSSQYGDASATASVESGALKARASASGYDFNPGPGRQPGGASAGAVFIDTFVPLSSTIATGTLVDIDFDWTLTYSMTGTGCGEVSDVYAYIQLSGFYVNGQNAGGTVRQLQDSTCNQDFELDASQFQVKIGEEFEAYVFLLVSASGVALTSTDAGNTLRLAVRPLDDYTLSTASGNDYTPSVQAVPEPTGLLAVGLGALLLRRRQARR